MAEFAVHILQANHNRDVANLLIEQHPFHDWAITAAFYAAIHFFEAWLYDRGERHTETSIPVDSASKLLYSAHAWREKLVERDLPKEAFKAFRLLRDASETARYLSLYQMRTSTGRWIRQGAWEYFDQEAARKLVQSRLTTFQTELKIELATFVHALELDSKIGVSAPLIRKQLLTQYKTKNHFLAEAMSNLKSKFGPQVAQVLIDGAASLGEPFKN